MPLTPERLEELIFGTERFRRFTQDSPVMPDVWIAYGLDPKARQDLLLTPHVQASAPELGHALRERLGGRQMRQGLPDEPRVAYNESYVAAELDFEELVKVALPLTHWWHEHVWRTKADLSDAEALRDPAVKKRVAAQLADAGASGFGGDVSPDLLWLMRVVGRIEVERRGRKAKTEPTNEQLVEAVLDLVAVGDVADASPEPLLWRVDRNRPARAAISRSILAVKADAATRLFDLSCRELAVGRRRQRDRRDAPGLPEARREGRASCPSRSGSRSGAAPPRRTTRASSRRTTSHAFGSSSPRTRRTTTHA